MPPSRDRTPSGLPAGHDELDFALRAADYLARMGLSPDEIVDSLVEQVDLSRDDAEALIGLAFERTRAAS